MSCSYVSGLVSDVLITVGDDGAATYTSGQVEALIFKNLTTLNALMGTNFSGVDSCISPICISGSIYQAILENLVAKELIKKSFMSASRNFNLTSFTEGDSKVTVSDSARNLNDLYKILNAEFDKLVNQAKYTIVSENPASIVGTDAAAATEGSMYAPVPNYYPKQS